MKLVSGHRGNDVELIQLFRTSFAESEGQEEGDLIARLVLELLDTPEDDLFVFSAEADGALIGGTIFSRLKYEHDERTVFVLGPVAVRPDHQGKGVGQQLITEGLVKLGERGVDIVMTYGDPAYYKRVGFGQISEAEAAAPFPLQQPQGWMTRSLSGQVIGSLCGQSSCVEALNDPVFW